MKASTAEGRLIEVASKCIGSIDYWESLTNRIHGKFQQSIYDACFGRSLVMFDQSTPNQSGIWNPRCSVS